MSDDMRDMFFIVKGQYRKGVAPSFVNNVSGDVSWVGGYDPYSDDTEEWYMVLDNKTFHCVACGGTLKKVLDSVYNVIVKHKGDAKRYFKYLSTITSEDYYETHYLGRRPLTHEERVKKAEGRCPRVSPIMRCLYENIYKEYGDYFSDEVKEVVERAYQDLEDRKPHNKARKLVSKTKAKGVVKPIEPTPRKEVKDTPTLKKINTKARVGLKKIK